MSAFIYIGTPALRYLAIVGIALVDFGILWALFGDIKDGDE